MRLTPVLVASGLAALAMLPAPSQAVEAKPWVPTSRIGLASVTAEHQGELPGRPGNWHTVVVSLSGADGVTGVVADWTCADGVEPNYADVGAEWTCTPESYGTIAAATDEDGGSLVRVTVNRPTRTLLARGLVAVTDDSGVSTSMRLRLQVNARGEASVVAVDGEDGLTRTVTVTRTDSRARVRVAGVVVRPNAWEMSTSDLVSVTTWTSVSHRGLPG